MKIHVSLLIWHLAWLSWRVPLRMQRNGISLLLILLKRTLAKWRSISGNRVQCKGLKTLQDEVANLKRPLYDSLKHNMKNMFGVHEQVLEQARKLLPWCHNLWWVAESFKVRSRGDSKRWSWCLGFKCFDLIFFMFCIIYFLQCFICFYALSVTFFYL